MTGPPPTEFRVLGPLDVRVHGTPVAIGTGKRRTLLNLLLLDANHVVAAERLMEELWHGRPPATAPAALQNSVAQLRKLLPDGVLVTHPGGYELRTEPGATDAERVDEGVRHARTALAAGRPEVALELLDATEPAWRGPPWADLVGEGLATAEAARLDDLRAVAAETRVDAELALGRHVDAATRLPTLIAQHPLRERLRAQLMLALYRSDRQADALAAYQDARRTLVDELGLEPGTELRELEARILAQDPTLVGDVTQPRRAAAPAPATCIVGRAAELAAIADLIETCRLVTLIGPGGSGKTRLALELAGDAVWVDLAPLSRAEDVPDAIAQAAGLVATEAPDAAALAAALPAGLLVLDNVEHVLGCAPLVGALLAAASGLRILTTSRTRLSVAGEQLYPVPPLELPEPDMPAAALAGVEAIALFGARARAADPAFDLEASAGAVAELCRRLDGLPLAIELAAARARALTPEQMLARPDDRLDIGGPVDVPERQRTLRATIEWSLRDLGDAGRHAYAALSVFAGGCTLDAAEAVLGDRALAAVAELLDRSLLVAAGGRFSMLQTIRDHAGEQLGDGPDVRRRQADWAIALAHEAAPQLVGPDQDAWLERLELEHPNLRAALDWLLENDGRGAVALAGSLWRFWLTRGHLQEGRDRLAAALAAERTPLALYGLAAIVYWLGDTDAADALWDEALAGYRAADDVHGIATTLNNLAMVAQYRGDLDSAQARYEEALAHCRDQPRAEAVSVLNLGILAGDRGEHDAALERFERALQLFREQGDVRATADVLGSLANQLRAADPAAAKRYAEESLEAFERLGDALGASEALQTLAGLAGGERAAELLEDALARSREAGDPWGTARALDGLARLALGAGERERARTLATEALALHERLEHPVGAAESRAILDGLG